MRQLMCSDPFRMPINRGRGYKNLRYLLLKAKRMAVMNVEFMAVRSIKKVAQNGTFLGILAPSPDSYRTYYRGTNSMPANLSTRPRVLLKSHCRHRVEFDRYFRQRTVQSQRVLPQPQRTP